MAQYELKDFLATLDKMEESTGRKLDIGIRKIVEILYNLNVDGDHQQAKPEVMRSVGLNDARNFAGFIQEVVAPMTCDTAAAKLMKMMNSMPDDAFHAIVGLGLIDGIAIGVELARAMDE